MEGKEPEEGQETGEETLAWDAAKEPPLEAEGKPGEGCVRGLVMRGFGGRG